MLIFTKLTYRNFLSTGNEPTVIDLNETSSTLVVGTNGAGKSTMLDALSFVLFNKPHRSIAKPQLVNSINNKQCLVTIEFEIGDIKYKIIRGIKPNIFEIYQNGIAMNQESHSRDYQKLLETNILKLNHKSFHQVVVLGSSNFIPFMQLTTYQRRAVIEDLLDIGVFTKMNILLKEETAKQKDLIKDTDHQLNLVSEKIKLQTRHLDELQSIDARNAKKVQVEIDDLRSEIEKIQSSNRELTDEYELKYAPLKAELDNNQKILNQLSGFESNIKFNIKSIVEDAKFYENNDSCPTCSQTISEETKESKLHVCKSRASELNEGFIQLKESIKTTSASVNEAAAALGEISKLPMKVSSNNHIIDSHQNRINFLSKQLNVDVDSKDVDRATKSLLSLRESRLTLSELRIKQIEDRTYSEVISELLKDTGIKTKIIKQYLPVMNKLINQYLQILDFFVSFNLDESFNETIKSRHRDDFSYASFSEGEKARIDLSLLFAWRQIAKMKNSANTNLLILDETFDGSMDADGVENLMQILSTLDSSTRVFIISHKQDVLEGKFERKLEFEKHKNFSRVKVDA
jgi:DNA repair exonuclease SbcCD ATPase subunit